MKCLSYWKTDVARLHTLVGGCIKNDSLNATHAHLRVLLRLLELCDALQKPVVYLLKRQTILSQE